MCDGRAYNSNDSEYSKLFSVIAWGDGSDDNNQDTNFNVPDLRGIFLRGVDAGAGKDPDSTTRVEKNGDTVGDVVGEIQEDSYGIHRHVIEFVGQIGGSAFIFD